MLMKYRLNYFLLFIAMIVLSNNLRAQQAAEKSDFVIPGSGTMTVAVDGAKEVTNEFKPLIEITKAGGIGVAKFKFFDEPGR